MSILNKILRPFLDARLRRATSAHLADPCPRTILVLARALLGAGRPDDAYVAISRARRSFPDDPGIRKAYTRIRTEQARCLLGRTREILRHDSSLQHFLKAAELARAMGDLRGASAHAEEAAAIYPDHWAVEFTIGRIEFDRFKSGRRAEDGEKCLAHLRRSREINPDHYKTLFFLAWTCALLGERDEAIGATERILASLPGDEKALRLRNYVLRVCDEAERVPDAAEEQAPAGDGQGASLVDRLCSLEGVPAAFLLDSEGEPAGSATRPTGEFDLTDAAGVARAMAGACRIDAERIGVGSFQSCLISGETWQVLIRDLDGKSVAVFLDGSGSGAAVESVLDEIHVPVS